MVRWSITSNAIQFISETTHEPSGLTASTYATCPAQHALVGGVRVPVAGVAAPRDDALGRHVVGAPADRELAVDVRAEAAPDHLGVEGRRREHGQDLEQGRRRWERTADAARNDQGRARGQRREAKAVEVDDRLGV